VRRCDARGAASQEVARCDKGTACRTTRNGPACAACDPSAVPTCKDDRFIVACKDDGTVETTDCAAQRRRCLHGTCVDTVCAPGQLHCSNGGLYRCNAAGSGRALVEDCLAMTTGDGARAVCQPDLSPPACRKTCKSPGGATVVLSQIECGACEWDKAAFCEEESPERACSTITCADSQLSAGATMLPCRRETRGLVVPGSERRGPCAGTGEIGSMSITYEVCQDGKPTPASRVAPCPRR
jgi:hypothetical protein